MNGRVQTWIESMTLEEKAWHLVGSYVGIGVEAEQPEYLDREDARELVTERAIGSVTPFGIGSSPHTTPQAVAELANDLQHAAREDSRLGIPLSIPVDATHGHAYIEGATVFPCSLGLAASFDTDLTKRVGEVTATEVRATGATQTYAPTADVVRDPRWGRTYETFGESPTVVAAHVASSVRGLQGDSLEDPTAAAATAKHFPAYGQPTRGEDAAHVDVSETTIRRVFLPPFERAVDAGVASIMPCYNAIDGEPVHGSRRQLRDRLRELEFDGVVVSDWNGVEMLETHHNTARDRRDAVSQSRQARLDVASIGRSAHAEALIELVEDGDLPESALDRSLERVLSLKVKQGLHEDPFVDPEACVETLGCASHRAVSLEAARKSIVLLENDDLLPLSGGEPVCLTGHNADDIRNQYGGWSAVRDVDLPGVTVADGLEAVHDGAVSLVDLPMREAPETALDAVVEEARESDVAVVVGGENWYLHEFGPSVVSPDTEPGEFPTRSDLALPQAQRDVLTALAEVETPTVLVLVSGRPLSFDPDLVDAALMAFFPGMDGGTAIAEILTGETEPTGSLPLSWPRSAGQLPVLFDYLEHPHPIGDDEHPPSYDPQYPFGHGLGYADVSYHGVDVPETVGPHEPLEATVTLENEGERATEECVIVFGRDPLASRVTPRRVVLGFDRVELAAGQRRRVEISLDLDAVGVVQGDERIVEEGTIEVSVADCETALEVMRGQGN